MLCIDASTSVFPSFLGCCWGEEKGGEQVVVEVDIFYRRGLISMVVAARRR
jgi:hypothetical protein